MELPFCELMDMGVEIDDDWYNVGNIDYDTLDDLCDDLAHLFEHVDLEQLEGAIWMSF